MHDFIIPDDHPALPGHFPGQPLVPGVVVTDRVIALLAVAHPGLCVTGIRKLKVLRPVLPGQCVSVHFAEPKNQRLRFYCEHDGEKIAEGNLELAEGSGELAG